MKIKSVHNEIFVFDPSKMLKVKDKHVPNVFIVILGVVGVLVPFI